MDLFGDLRLDLKSEIIFDDGITLTSRFNITLNNFDDLKLASDSVLTSELILLNIFREPKIYIEQFQLNIFKNPFKRYIYKSFRWHF